MPAAPSSDAAVAAAVERGGPPLWLYRGRWPTGRRTHPHDKARTRARCGSGSGGTTLRPQARRSALPVKRRSSGGAARPQGGGGATTEVPHLQCHMDGDGLPTAPVGRKGEVPARQPHDSRPSSTRAPPARRAARGSKSGLPRLWCATSPPRSPPPHGARRVDRHARAWRARESAGRQPDPSAAAARRACEQLATPTLPELEPPRRTAEHVGPQQSPNEGPPSLSHES